MQEHSENVPPLELHITAHIPRTEQVKALHVISEITERLGVVAIPETVTVELNEYQPPPPPAISAQEKYNLTDREIEVIHLAAQGLTSNEIGGRLHLSGASIKGYISNVIRKTNANNRTQMVCIVLGINQHSP